jgi:hypothetical protein
MVEKSTVNNITERANSFCGRYGGVGTDFKIYWDTVEQLTEGLKAVGEGQKVMMSMIGGPEE